MCVGQRSDTASLYVLTRYNLSCILYLDIWQTHGLSVLILSEPSILAGSFSLVTPSESMAESESLVGLPVDDGGGKANCRCVECVGNSPAGIVALSMYDFWE